MKLVAIILTLNEAQHLPRGIQSLGGIASIVVAADCDTTDATVDIAKAHGLTMRPNLAGRQPSLRQTPTGCCGLMQMNI